MFTLWSLLKIIHHRRDSQRGAFLSRGVLRPAGKVDQAWQQDLDKWVHHLLSPCKPLPGFWRLLTWRQRCNFCQTCSRAERDWPMCSTWRTIDNQRLRSKIRALIKLSRFFRRVGSDPYPKAVLCLLLYQDKSPWILICPDNSILFCHFALAF